MPVLATTSITDQLLGQGVLGICVLVLAGVIVFLQRKNDSQRAQIDKLNEQRLADRDLRLEDQKANAKVILELFDRFKETVTDSTAATRELTEALQDLKQELQSGRQRPYR